MEPAEEHLYSFCKEEAGEALRAIFSYTKDSGEVIYARASVEDAFRGEPFDELRESAWQIHQTILAEAPRIKTIGRYRVTVHAFEEGFVMQFRKTEDEGICLSFDREVGRNLHEFLLQCEQYLEPAR